MKVLKIDSKSQKKLSLNRNLKMWVGGRGLCWTLETAENHRLVHIQYYIRFNNLERTPLGVLLPLLTLHPQLSLQYSSRSSFIAAEAIKRSRRRRRRRRGGRGGEWQRWYERWEAIRTYSVFIYTILSPPVALRLRQPPCYLPSLIPMTPPSHSPSLPSLLHFTSASPPASHDDMHVFMQGR